MMAALQLRDDILQSSDDNTDDELLANARKARVFLERRDHFQEFDNEQFRVRFRLTKEAALEVLREIEHLLEYESDRNKSLSPINQLLLTLQFYASGSFLITLADFSGVSKATAQRVVHRVSRALAGMSQTYIKFPETEAEMRKTQLEFYNVARFPRVLGCIDCTHIKILSPGGLDAETYRNRKGFFSLNLQVVCNANLEVTDIVARWPGSAHDSTIYNASYRHHQFETGRFGNGLLLGDSGYPLSNTLMVPIDGPANRAEERFNESHIRTRNCVERLFGVWKRRFPCLALGFRFKMDRIYPIIVATAVLHNILRRRHEEVLLMTLIWIYLRHGQICWMKG